MIIKKLKFDGNDNFPILTFNDGVNIIIGDTNVGKSLIYSVIETVFGAEDKLDLLAMKKNYPSATKIECTIENNHNIYIIERYIYEKKVNIFNNGICVFSSDDLIKYGNYIFSLFNFKSDVQLIKGTNLDASLLTLREYCVFMFFSESRLVEEHSFLCINGPTMITKYKHLFGYLVSGEQINADKLESRTIKDKVKNSRSDIVKYLTNYKTTNLQSFNKNDVEENDLLEEIKKIESCINEIKNVIENNKSNIKSNENELFKYTSILEYYEQENLNNNLALEFSNYLKKYKFVCKHCGTEYQNELLIGEDIKNFDTEKIANIIKNTKRNIDVLKEETLTLNEKLLELEKNLLCERKKLEEFYNNKIISKAYDTIIKNVDVDLKENKIVLTKLEDIEKVRNSIDLICDEIKKELTIAGLFDNPVVTFDYSHRVFDFLIDSERRTIIGKGDRTFITIIFLIKLCLISMKKVGFIGFSIIDSPWTNLKFKNKSKETQAISTIINYVKKSKFQTILFDNEIPDFVKIDNDVKVIEITKK